MVSNKDQNVKERILEVSINLFLAKGFAGTSVKELTDAAGVAKGTLYWYFSSKDQILEEILEKFSRELYDVVIERVNSCDGDFITRFMTLYRFITEFAREKRELLLVSNTVLGEIVGSGTNAERKLKEIQMKFHDFLRMLLDDAKKEGIVKKDLDTDLQAHIMIASFIGMHLQWCLHGDSFEAGPYARLFRDTILKGLGIE
jgi:TetR/AcrR family transcriptional regulator, fatty acid metabolism regulator protein